mmetsp:Transcript_27066/g.53994  ORF Transcript_27066/g.53994 Transcript_27066/m.53994 type:complete len:224 (+) Transcript_27066:1338-2009(+)
MTFLRLSLSRYLENDLKRHDVPFDHLAFLTHMSTIVPNRLHRNIPTSGCSSLIPSISLFIWIKFLFIGNFFGAALLGASPPFSSPPLLLSLMIVPSRSRDVGRFVRSSVGGGGAAVGPVGGGGFSSSVGWASASSRLKCGGTYTPALPVGALLAGFSTLDTFLSVSSCCSTPSCDDLRGALEPLEVLDDIFDDAALSVSSCCSTPDCDVVTGVLEPLELLVDL